MGSRLWNRREFTVTLNGRMPILRPDGWFAVVSWPRIVRSLTGQSIGPSSPQAHKNSVVAVPHEWATLSGQMAPAQADSRETAIGSLIARLRPLARPAVIAMVATAVMWVVLWWLCSLGSALNRG
jgi:hypothetical protein